MKKFVILLVAVIVAAQSVFAVDLVKEGKAVSEIIIAENATPSVKTAANELQRHLLKISGAKLAIVNTPSADVKNHIYVGGSKFTRDLGVDLSDIKKDGYKIIAKDNYLILAGKEFYHYTKLRNRWLEESDAFIPGRNNNNLKQKLWEEYTKSNWKWPCYYDFQAHNHDNNFNLLDGTGTLYSIYALLEQLGWRWFMPVEDIGIVYLELKTITVNDQNLKREPEFAIRAFVDKGYGQYNQEFLWLKSMGIGTSVLMPSVHTVGSLLYKPKKQPKEYFAKISGKLSSSQPKLTSERLREDLVKYLKLTADFFPSTKYVSIGQSDGWYLMDDDDAKAGWDRFKTRGPKGRFSALLWDFTLDIRKRYMKLKPDTKFTCGAYGPTLRPPADLKKIPDNMTVKFCQGSPRWWMPATKEQDLKYRNEWLSKMNHENQLLMHEWYLQHASTYNTPPVPIIFTKNMKENFDGLYGKAAGFYVETGWTSTKTAEKLQRALPKIGITHFNLYLHNKLCWNRNLNIEELLNDYCDKFFGPAKKEMKEFYTFAEKVWCRPESHTITLNGGFLKKEDVNKYFKILNDGLKKAGDSIYGKRIAFIKNEMEPLKLVHDNLQRTGPMIRAYYAPSKPVIDGDLSDRFWQETKDSFYTLRDKSTSEFPGHLKTTVSFRWLPTKKALVVGIECYEPNMDKLREGCKDRDSLSIFSDDNIEILIESTEGLRPKIVINSAGMVYDHCLTKNVADLPSWYKVDQFAIKKYKDRWTVEAVIYAEKIAGDKPSEESPWGINICRQRMAGNTPEYYMLSPGKNFKDTKCMGNLYLRK